MSRCLSLDYGQANRILPGHSGIPRIKNFSKIQNSLTALRQGKKSGERREEDKREREVLKSLDREDTVKEKRSNRQNRQSIGREAQNRRHRR